MGPVIGLVALVDVRVLPDALTVGATQSLAYNVWIVFGVKSAGNSVPAR